MQLAFTEKIDDNLGKIIEAWGPIADKLQLPSLDHLNGTQELLFAIAGAVILTGLVEAVFKPAAIWLTQRLLLDNISEIWKKINKRMPAAIGGGQDLDGVYDSILWGVMGRQYGDKPGWFRRAAISSLKAEYSPEINAQKIRESS